MRWHKYRNIIIYCHALTNLETFDTVIHNSKLFQLANLNHLDVILPAVLKLKVSEWITRFSSKRILRDDLLWEFCLSICELRTIREEVILKSSSKLYYTSSPVSNAERLYCGISFVLYLVDIDI